MSGPRFLIFRAETIEAMRRAFEEVCGRLQLTGPGEQPRAIVATKIFELGKGGERDASRRGSWPPKAN